MDFNKSSTLLDYFNTSCNITKFNPSIFNYNENTKKIIIKDDFISKVPFHNIDNNPINYSYFTDKLTTYGNYYSSNNVINTDQFNINNIIYMNNDGNITTTNNIHCENLHFDNENDFFIQTSNFNNITYLEGYFTNSYLSNFNYYTQNTLPIDNETIIFNESNELVSISSIITNNYEGQNIKVENNKINVGHKTNGIYKFPYKSLNFPNNIDFNTDLISYDNIIIHHDDFIYYNYTDTSIIHTLNISKQVSADILIVAGGGGGGYTGGGGSGSCIIYKNYIFNIGNYIINIGKGGTGSNGSYAASNGNDTYLAIPSTPIELDTSYSTDDTGYSADKIKIIYKLNNNLNDYYNNYNINIQQNFTDNYIFVRETILSNNNITCLKLEEGVYLNLNEYVNNILLNYVYTITLWFKITSNTNYIFGGYLKNINYNTFDLNVLKYDHNTNHIYWCRKINNNSYIDKIEHTINNQWNHITLMSNITNGIINSPNIYINNLKCDVLEANDLKDTIFSDIVDTFDVQKNTYFKLGGYFNNSYGTKHFSDFRLYNYILSNDEINYIYNYISLDNSGSQTIPSTIRNEIFRAKGGGAGGSDNISGLDGGSGGGGGGGNGFIPGNALNNNFIPYNNNYIESGPTTSTNFTINANNGKNLGGGGAGTDISSHSYNGGTGISNTIIDEIDYNLKDYFLLQKNYICGGGGGYINGSIGGLGGGGNGNNNGNGYNATYYGSGGGAGTLIGGNGYGGILIIKFYKDISSTTGLLKYNDIDGWKIGSIIPTTYADLDGKISWDKISNKKFIPQTISELGNDIYMSNLDFTFDIKNDFSDFANQNITNNITIKNLRDYNKNSLKDLDGNGYIHIDNIQDINPPYTTFNEYLESIPDNKTITISDNKLGIQHLPENNQLNNVNITIYDDKFNLGFKDENNYSFKFPYTSLTNPTINDSNNYGFIQYIDNSWQFNYQNIIDINPFNKNYIRFNNSYQLNLADNITSSSDITNIINNVNNNPGLIFCNYLYSRYDIVSFSTTLSSDFKLKKNIKSLKYSKELMKLIPISYKWIDTNNDNFGLIAQDVEEILPHLIKNNYFIDNNYYKTINYNGLIPYMIKHIQDLQLDVNNLKKKEIKI